MPATHEPRFETYELVDAHSGRVVSTHPSRRAAESHITSHAHRVRGGRPVRKDDRRRPSLVELLRRARRR